MEVIYLTCLFTQRVTYKVEGPSQCLVEPCGSSARGYQVTDKVVVSGIGRCCGGRGEEEKLNHSKSPGQALKWCPVNPVGAGGRAGQMLV